MQANSWKLNDATRRTFQAQAKFMKFYHIIESANLVVHVFLLHQVAFHAVSHVAVNAVAIEELARVAFTPDANVHDPGKKKKLIATDSSKL